MIAHIVRLECIQALMEQPLVVLVQQAHMLQTRVWLNVYIVLLDNLLIVLIQVSAISVLKILIKPNPIILLIVNLVVLENILMKDLLRAILVLHLMKIMMIGLLYLFYLVHLSAILEAVLMIMRLIIMKDYVKKNLLLMF